MPPPPQGADRAQKNTFGGFQTISIFSGGSSSTLSGSAIGAISGDLLLVSGPGRLDFIQPHQAVSGAGPTLFYDSAVAANGVTGGGPVAASGHKVVGVLPANTWASANASGAIGVIAPPYQFSMPFQSGLCVALRSGSCGYTISWTPEPGNQ
jgi:hypothetical protein